MTSPEHTEPAELFTSAPLASAFYQSSAFFPMPVMIVATRTLDGQPNLAPYSLCFPQPAAGERMLMLISKGDSNTARNIAATGLASLCFIRDDQRLLDNCVQLGRPAPSAEKMRRSLFTLVQERGRPVIAEAEQVFLCSLQDEQPGVEAGERRLLLRVDDVLLKARWLRALERGWGAPRLAVEFGFRGSSASWLSRPHVQFAGPSLRPRFEVVVNMTVADASDSLRRALEATDTPVEGFARDATAQVNIPADEASFWSPELEIKIDEVDGKARLRGRIGPHPHVWMMFMGLHMVIAICALGGLIFGASQWSLDQPAWGLWAGPAAVVLHAFVAGAAFVGQGLGAEHVFRLRAFVDDALTR